MGAARRREEEKQSTRESTAGCRSSCVHSGLLHLPKTRVREKNMTSRVEACAIEWIEILQVTLVRFQEAILEMEDDPFETKLHLNHELGEDEVGDFAV